MTRARLHPDYVRVDPDTRTWIIAAGHAHAKVWQVAVFVQRTTETVYRVWRAEGVQRRRWQPRSTNQCVKCGHPQVRGR